MKIGKSRPKSVAGTTPVRKKGDPKPADWVCGPPTKYREEYCGALVKYFREAESWEINYDLKNSGKVLPKTRMPTFERFAADLGVTLKTMHLWCDAHPEFANAYEIAKSLQKAFLMELGAAGVGNHTLALMLRTNHGMKDDPEESNEVKPLEIRIVKARRPGEEEAE